MTVETVVGPEIFVVGEGVALLFAGVAFAARAARAASFFCFCRSVRRSVRFVGRPDISCVGSVGGADAEMTHGRQNVVRPV